MAKFILLVIATIIAWVWLLIIEYTNNKKKSKWYLISRKKVKNNEKVARRVHDDYRRFRKDEM